MVLQSTAPSLVFQDKMHILQHPVSWLLNTLVSYHKPQWKNTLQTYPSEGYDEWLSSAKTCIYHDFKNSSHEFQYTTYCNKKKCPGHLKLKSNCIMSQSRLLTLLLLTVSTVCFFLPSSYMCSSIKLWQKSSVEIIKCKKVYLMQMSYFLQSCQIKSTATLAGMVWM